MHVIYIGSSHCSARQGIKIFSDCSLLLDVTVLVSKLKKNGAKYHQINFLTFTFNPEVRNSSKMFVIRVKCLSSQNGRIKFYSVWVILFFVHTPNLARATDEFQNLEKCDSLKNA